MTDKRSPAVDDDDDWDWDDEEDVVEDNELDFISTLKGASSGQHSAGGKVGSGDTRDESSWTSRAAPDDEYEFDDFTCASPWERLVSAVEDQFRSWGIHDGGIGYVSELVEESRGAKPPQVVSPCCHFVETGVACMGRDYVLRYYFIPNSDDLPRSVYRGDMTQLSPGSLVRRVFHTSSDHQLTKWFGIYCFVVVSAPGRDIGHSEASFLLSSLALAANHCGCRTACLVRLSKDGSGVFCGRSSYELGMSARFDVKLLRIIDLPGYVLGSDAEVNLEGLTRFFDDFVGPRRLNEQGNNHMIHLSYTYVHSAEDWDIVERTSRYNLDWRKAGDDENICPGAFWGPMTDPVSSFELRLSWNYFREGVFVENEVYSGIRRATAIWNLQTSWRKPNAWVDNPLRDGVKQLVKVCAAGFSCATITQCGTGDPAFAQGPAAPGASADAAGAAGGAVVAPQAVTAAAAAAAGANIADRPVPTSFEALASGTLPVRSGATGLRIADVDAGGSSFMAVRALNKVGGAIKAFSKADPIPSREFFDEAIHSIFPHRWHVGEQDEESALPHAVEGLDLGKLPPAPFGSLLSVLVFWMLRANEENALSLRTVVIMWRKFVNELRVTYWEHAVPLPRLCSGSNPELKFCVLHQKLQLLQHCIRRRRAKEFGKSAPAQKLHSNELSAPKRADNVADGWDWDVSWTQDPEESEDDGALHVRQSRNPAQSSKLQHKSTGSVSKRPKPSKKVGCAVRSLDADEGPDLEEFDFDDFDNVGCGGTAIASGLTRGGEANTDTRRVGGGDGGGDGVDEDDEDDDDDTDEFFDAVDLPSPRGVHAELKDMRLMDGRVMNVPVTQDVPPLTEDAYLEQQRVFELLGPSEEGSRRRMEIQCAGVVSDMKAFKAANPGCVFADFVRWHSPKDWLPASPPERDGIPQGELSGRMCSPAWQHLWSTAPAEPAEEQELLFKYLEEAEKILGFLEEISPHDLFRQLCWIAICNSYELLSRVCDGATENIESLKGYLKELRDSIHQFASEYAPVSPALSAASPTSEALYHRFLEMVPIIGVAETLCARAFSLCQGLPGDVDLINRVLDEKQTTWVELNKTQWSAVCAIFRDHSGVEYEDGDESFPLPAKPNVKQFTFVHAEALAAAQLSMGLEDEEEDEDDVVVVAHRMYVRIENGRHVRLAVAKTTLPE